MPTSTARTSTRYDVLCLIYSADWYRSGDTGEETYRKDVEFFKNKWLKAEYKNLVKEEIDKNIEETRNELYTEFGVKK